MSTTSKSNPLFMIAILSVITFCTLGIATVMGWIPGAHSAAVNASVGTPPPGSAPQTASTLPAGISRMAVPPPGSAPQVATTQEGSAPPVGVPPPGVDSAQAAPIALCQTCGTISSVRAVEVQGQGTGLGAVAGGVLGAVVGHQVGQGNGNTLATLVGVGGGALAGNAVEKNARASTHWEVSVALTTGGTRVFHYASQPGFSPGDPVRIRHNRLALAR